ncbi:ABC transporter permease [Kordiimonas sediminis]|uniref:ABC transporter permease n=1 Tax=Kordiimonas sediminis TaxID=1735581 RepID=A0A919ASK2_9PROT|nr:ABC transporter permease [Kordiimonas sediminis]GHF19963.1 ABC transporter permease [Kordiimonas sediminis]
MIRHYLKIAGRAMARNKLFSFLNMAGLAIGLAAFILITLFVHNEFSWDDHWQRSEDIYRVEGTITFPVREDRPTPNAPGPVKDLLEQSFSGVEAIARHIVYPTTVKVGETLYAQQVIHADNGFMDFWNVPLLAGDSGQALSDPSGVIISERLARTYFTNTVALTDVLGSTISVNIQGQMKMFRITGVAKNPADTTHAPMDMIVRFNRQNFDGARWFSDGWRSNPWKTYIRVAPDVDVAAMEAELPKLLEAAMPPAAADQDPARRRGLVLDLRAVGDIHLYGNDSSADVSSLYGMLAIAFLILLIAVINFLNLSMARVAYRSREVAVRKVVGAGNTQIMQQFLGESVLFAFVSLLLALVMVEVSLPYYNAFLNAVIEIDFLAEPLVLVLILLLGLGVGLSAGSFHALYFAYLKPGEVLYNNSSDNPGGSFFRKVLVVGQFTIAIALMTVAVFVNRQIEYASRVDLGFDDQNLLVVSGVTADVSDTFKQTLLSSPFISAVGRSSDVPTEGSEDRLQILPNAGGEKVTLDGLPIGPDFFSVYNIPLAAGRYLTNAEPDILRSRLEEGEYRGAANILINAAGAKVLGFDTPEAAVGYVGQVNLSTSLAFEGRIVGIVQDFHFDSLRSAIRPGVYYVDQMRIPDMTLRIDSKNRDAAISVLEEAWREFFPSDLLAYREMTQMVEDQYQLDMRLGTMLTGFTILAFVISCLGLYGLAAFMIERRTREIGIRKVLGAAVPDIMGLLLWQFSKPILIAILIAGPFAFLFLQDWLQAFAYRIDLTLLPFIGVCSATLMIGWVTVFGHVLAVSRKPPITAIRYE